MARKALGIPKNVNIDTWIADHVSGTLDGIKGKAEALDGKKVTIDVNTVYTETGPKPDGYVAKNGIPAFNADGGRVNYLARGGRPRLYDMTPKGTDTVPTMLTPGEFVVNAASTAKNLPLLEAVNAGHQYSPASAPARQAAPMPATNSGPMQMTGTLVMDSGEVLGVFRGVAVAAAQGVVAAADSQSQFSRRGR
jgi:hypothetical protein